MARFWCYNATKTHNPLTDRPHREWCQQVHKDHKRKRREGDAVAVVAGWGEFGFATRPEQRETVEVKVEGDPYHKSGRKSVARPKKPRCKLACKSESRGRDRLGESIAEAQRRKGQPRWRARKGQRPVR